MERTARSLPIPVLNTTLGPQIEWGARSVPIEIFPLSNSEDETHIPNQAMFSLQKVLLPAYFLPGKQLYHEHDVWGPRTL